MQLTILGTSGTYPAPNGACSGYLLETNGKHILIDCGSGVLARLQRSIPIEALDAIVLSHLHYDHIADLFSLRYGLETLKALGIAIPPIPFVLPATPESLVAELTEGDLFAPTIVGDGDAIDLLGLRLRFDRMPHLIETHAVTFTSDSAKFVFSGDTGDNDRLAHVVRDADLLLCESTFARNGDVLASDHHLAAEDAGRIAAQAGVKRLLLTHLWPRAERADYLNAAAQHFPSVELAQELTTYPIGA